MARTKSEFLGGFGKAFEILKAIIDAVMDLGGTDEDLRKILSSKKLRTDIAKLIISGAKNTLYVLSSLSLSDRIAHGKYNWVNSDITEEHFPTNIPADYDVEYKLFHFNRAISSDDAIREMEHDGFRPATLPELLTLGETFPDEQKKYPIVSLGSVWRGAGGGRRVPCLGWYDGERRLFLGWFEFGWGGDDRFLGARK